MDRTELKTLAKYNLWANERVYDAARSLPDDAYRLDRGAFFGSVHGTLNHILVADRIWLRRITGDGPIVTALDAILYDTLDELALARRAEDGRILALADRLSAPALAGPLTYANTAGTPFTQRLSDVLMHLFNHQTHHRGQVHALLTGFGREVPTLDLIAFLRDRPGTTERKTS
ncbi:DinB family protein [Marinivivus vitaminiproducens]|uniref:DinB family protein n=1 Tax=Marinivivus vitaminiproducens TaxID=3035935 RepID=UPI0027996494|nr:DinB family protein [Geminicoccaceae bacterium SCSIO 64248]